MGPCSTRVLPRRDLKVSGAGSTRRDWDAAVSELPLSPLLLVSDSMRSRLVTREQWKVCG